MSYHYTSIRIAKIKLRVTSPNTGEDMDKPDHSYIVVENIKWYNHSGKQFGSFLKNKLNMRLLYDPATALLNISLREMKKAYTNLYMKVYTGSIFNSPKLETM